MLFATSPDYGSSTDQVVGGSSKGPRWSASPAEGVRRGELHWYEAHGFGKKELKRKRYLD